MIHRPGLDDRRFGNQCRKAVLGWGSHVLCSGYCIAASIDSLRRRPHSLSNYLFRRFRRIYPPLWIASGVCILISCAVASYPPLYEACLQIPRLAEYSIMDWIANITVTQSWLGTLLGQESKYRMHNTWTLCFEEQSYAVTDLLLVFWPRRFFVTAYVVAGLTIIARHAARLLNIPIHGFFFDGHWLMFCCGIMVYERLNYLSGRGRRATNYILLAAMVYGLAERFLAHETHDRHLGEYILVASAFALALSWLKPIDRAVVSHRLAQPILELARRN